MTSIAAVDFPSSPGPELKQLVLLGAGVVLVTLAAYRLWMVVAGWWADWRWRRHGVDRRARPRGRRHDD
jgi:hypothetical protein